MDRQAFEYAWSNGLPHTVRFDADWVNQEGDPQSRYEHRVKAEVDAIARVWDPSLTFPFIAALDREIARRNNA